MSDKTERPTPRRLRKAREEGDAGASAQAAQAIAFVVGVAMVPASLLALASRAAIDLRAAFEQVAVRAEPRVDATSLAASVATLSLAPLLGVGLASGLAHLVQTAGVFSLKRVSPRLDRFDLVAGLARLFSVTRLVAVLRSLVAGVAVAWLAYRGLSAHVVDLARLVGRPRWVGPAVGDIARTLAWQVAFLGLALGGLDALVTRRAWLRRLRMSKEEIKREHREAEGDPQIKAARGRAHQEILAQATVESVRGATVIVVNPVHLACALRYDGLDAGPRGDEAPFLVAKGEGDLARRIVEVARAYGVPIVQDVPLARALTELELGQAIPEVLYEAVAEVLREVSKG